MINKTCATCQAYHEGLSGKECRLRAPQPVMFAGPTGTPGVMGVFPATLPANWCLEWKGTEDAGAAPESE